MSKSLHISTGLSATTLKWTNRSVTWEDLAKKLHSPTVTPETVKTYRKAPKADRSKIKDVGGYVGAYLRGGRRKPENVVHRQVLTLDADFAHMDFWDDFTMMFDSAAILHGTHSHSLTHPKFRLIMPLSREVSSDEYVALARRVAGDIGIDYFDNTGFQPYRLMFWSSHSSDAEFYIREQKGPWLDVDQVLARYIDWRDSSLYPTSEQYLSDLKDFSKKQQDPETKKGVIGAFCRVYTISSAIEEFLSEEYTQADDSRYTYINGSTFGGLVLYDDKFAYSHHGTDPISSKLCNAFDLVRVHKFGHLDIDPTKSSSTSKSFLAMQEMARELKEVKALMSKEAFEVAKYEFADIDVEEEEEDLFGQNVGIVQVEEIDLAWTENLEIDNKGKYLSTADNLNIIMKNDPRLKGRFALNSFDAKPYVMKSLPWRSVKEVEPLRDVDFSGLRNYMESFYKIVGSQKIEDVLKLTLDHNSFDPVKDYLESQDWDGTPRVDQLLVKYFHVKDNVYFHEAIRKPLVAAVARTFNAGRKFDLVLTLVGEEGTGKSTFINKLGNGWSSDSFSTVHGKEAFEQLRGAWLIEMAELSGVRKAEAEAVKHFITKREDTYRPAFGRVMETYKRRCVFFGTTNNRSFLKDPSGNRRFIPVDVLNLNANEIFKISQEEIDQIWAEAVVMYRRGEKLYMSAAAKSLAKTEQNSHRDYDERQGFIEDYLATPLPADWEELSIFEREVYLDKPEEDGVIRDTVCMAAIWRECFGKSSSDMDRYKTRDLNDIMRTIKGWELVNSTKNFKHYGKQRYFKRKTENYENSDNMRL